MTRKLPLFSLSAVKVATWVILLTLSNPAFCERRGIIIAFTMGGFSRSGLILGYGLTDKLSIEAHLGATACGTGVINTTVGISMKYRPIPDNEKFYLLAGWSKIPAESPLAGRSKIDDELPYRRVPRTDDQGNRYVITGYSTGLNLGLGHEFSNLWC